MARISSYGQDGTVDKNDKVLGTDSATGATKNYTVDSLLGLVNDENLVESFDGAAFEFQSYVDPANDPEGVINLNASTASDAAFSAINTLYISVKDKSGSTLTEYLENADNDFLKISKTDNLNQFGIYEVTAIEDYGSAKYKKLTVTPRGTNGTLTVGTKYFVANYSALYDQDFSDKSVTDFQDVSLAGSGEIITGAERASLNNFTNNGLVHGDVVDNVTSTTTDVPLSANQGKVLKDLIDTINTLLTSDNVDLDTLQEVVDYIETNRGTLDALGISNISGLQAALDLKQNAEAGKGLSANDFTDLLLAKLNGIESSADANVNADWAAVSGDAEILNKPTDLTNLSIHNVTALSDINSAGSGSIITGAERDRIDPNHATFIGLSSNERIKLTGIDVDATTRVVTDGTDSITVPPQGAQANVKANWAEDDASSDAFIQNKPSVALDSTTLEISGTINEIEVDLSGAQDLTANRAWTIGLPDDVTVTSDLTVGDTIELTNAQSTTPSFDNGFYHILDGTADTLHFRYGGKDLSIDYLTEVLPTGILNGGELSKANNTQFTIAAGDGIINDLNKSAGSDPHPEIVKVVWTQQTITVSNLDSNNTAQLNSWIYVDSTGTVQQQAGAFTDAQKRSNIIIGSAIHSEGVLKFVKTFPITAYNSASQLTEFANIFGPLKKSGHKVTANGANLSIDRSAGVAFALGRNYASDPENPSTVSDSAQVAATVHRYYRDGSNGFVLDDGVAGAGYTVLDPSKYDNGTGTLATVSGGHYSVQRLYYFPGTPSIIVSYYGHDEYNSLDEAEKNYSFEDFSEFENTAQQAIYLGAIIMSGGASALNNSAQAKILTAGSFRGLASVNVGGVAADAVLGDLGDVSISGVSNGQVLKYNSSAARWENQADAGGIALTDLSVGAEATASGDGAIAYNNTTGVFTFTPPDLSPYLTAAIDGSGTANALPKFSDTDTLTDSVISESGQDVIIATTGAIHVPDGTTAERPASPVAGMFRYNTDDNQFEGYTTEWGAIAGSGGGSAAFNTSSSLTGDGSTVTFSLGGTPGDADDVMVFLNGVYQEKANYSISGSNITFTTAPPNGYSIEAKYVTGTLDLTSVGEVTLKEYVGDGNTSTYALGTTPTSEAYVDAYIEGVYQEKGTYSVAGSNIVFDSNIPNGASIELKTTGTIPNSSVTQTTFVSDEFTADGSASNFTLVNGSPTSKSLTMVFIQGVYQAKSNYNLVSGEIQFTATPDEDDVIEVISMSAVNTAGSPVTSVNGEIGAVTVVSKHNVSVISANTTAAANTLYVFTANLNLTLPASPAIGDSIKISNRSAVETCQLLRNGNNILGAAENLTLDTASASFELVYTDATNGWVIIGQ